MSAPVTFRIERSEDSNGIHYSAFFEQSGEPSLVVEFTDEELPFFAALQSVIGKYSELVS